MTTKEYETLKKKGFERFFEDRKKLSKGQKFWNWFSILILDSRKEESELRRTVHLGVPLEYEVTDREHEMKDSF
jgi:hypothetical protein